MPIFEFRCNTCGHEFETLILPKRPAASCPKCQGEDLEKLLSSFAPSTPALRAANAQKSRQQQIAKNRDKVIADEEYRLHHDD